MPELMEQPEKVVEEAEAEAAKAAHFAMTVPATVAVAEAASPT